MISCRSEKIRFFQSPTFKLGEASHVLGSKLPGPGVPVPLLHHATHKKIITTEKVNWTCTKLNVGHSLFKPSKPYQISENHSELLSLEFWQPAIRRCFNKDNDFKDARKRSLLNCVPCVLKTCSRAYEPCVLTCLRANVPCVLTCSRANMACVLTCLHANVAYVLTCSRANVPTRWHVST